MLTLEENGWNFKSIKTYSTLNLLPIQIDEKTGQIQRRSSKTRNFVWRLLFWLGISHCFYIFLRLVQTTVLEPEKYFRWDHFIIHWACAVGYSLMCYTGYCMFVGNPEECVVVFNQLFVERENPVEKAMEQEHKEEQELKRKSGEKPGKKGVAGPKSQAWVELKSISVSVPDPNQQQQSSLEVRKTPESGSGVCSCPRIRPLLTWPPQYSLDELLAKTFPLIIEPTKLCVMLILSVDPSRPQLLYSSLPREWQNWLSFLGLLAAETVSLTFMCLCCGVSIVCQLLFFSKCQAEFKRLELQLRNLEEKFQRRALQNRDMKREIWILRQILKEMKELEVFIQLFNRCFPPCIFALKLMCLGHSILYYFFTIRHGADFPFLALFVLYMAVVVTLVYGILYEKAFSIPQKMEQLKTVFLLSGHKTTLNSSSTADDTNRNFRKEMQRGIGGIRDVGVKVGSFHTLERQSTPNFVDFVFRNVVSLLVTFP